MVFFPALDPCLVYCIPHVFPTPRSSVFERVLGAFIGALRLAW